MAQKPFKKISTMEELTVDQLLCHVYKHAWRDLDAMPMIWGSFSVEHWRLECTRCGGGATEYRDPVTCRRIGQRQYQTAPGYSTGINYSQADYLVELRRRRLVERAQPRRKARTRRSS